MACDPCVERWLSIHGDTVRSEGRAWALRVTWRLAEDPSQWPPWPVFDESPRVQAIAGRLSSRWAGADLRIRERFAGVCHAAASEHYEKERDKRSGVA